MISINSTELNYLVFRYLHESGPFRFLFYYPLSLAVSLKLVSLIGIGFTHSAYAFGFEAGINKSTIDGNLVPPGALVTFLQKGLQFLELEADLGNSVST